MTRDEIIKLAKEVDPFGDAGPLYAMAEKSPITLKRFAMRIAAAEREACAWECIKVEKAMSLAGYEDYSPATARLCIEAIRARSNT
jgi:hypothetical protein